MKNHHSDRKWIALILFFLAAETLWLLADMQIIYIPFFSHRPVTMGDKEAGHVIKVTDELKRRNSHGLIWEAIKENEILYYHDSVLTLSQSSAKLYLKDQTELQLSENTLVTLEEPDINSKSEIRLRFSKGDLKARNPVTKTDIQGDNWVVNLEKGAEVSLRKDKDSYQFEVLSGKATVQTAAGLTENLNDSSILKLGSDQQIQKIEKNQNLQWSDKKPLRVYVFEESAKVSFDWIGKVRNLAINRAGEEEKNQPVSEAEKSAVLDLKLGTYQIRLADENSLSTARTVEVRQAPRIFLKKPLPRDRLKIGETHEFIWAPEKSVKSYKISFGRRNETSVENFKSMRFDTEQDLDWHVSGEDDEGFLIPPFYESKIYLRKNPLQAPKLKVPSLRNPEVQKEKNGGALFKFRWWPLLVPVAHAVGVQSERTSERTGEITFEWESVTGADLYTIEITSDPDFRHPEVIEVVKAPRFLWKKYDSKKKYYWRVAAGSSKGQLGLFSEPIELKPIIEKTAPDTEPEPEPVPKKKPEPDVVEKSGEVIKPLAPDTDVKSEVSKPIKLPSGWALAWAPTYKLLELSGEQKSKIQLQGFVPLGLQLEFKYNNYHLQLWTASETWKPKPASDYPFQENLRLTESWLFVSKENLGLSVHQSLIPLRKSDESITYQPQTTVGFRYAPESCGVSLATSGSTHELNLDFKRKYYLDKYFYGVAGNVLYQTHKAGGGFQGNLIFLFGIESF